mmetsp:Transcript_137927/g.344309  ORF Transcript_137927/g.344309 Transcript_137927/m.344309 type:complete len:236 (-) Transcript_137927:7-714(-)
MVAIRHGSQDIVEQHPDLLKAVHTRIQIAQVTSQAKLCNQANRLCVLEQLEELFDVGVVQGHQDLRLDEHLLRPGDVHRLRDDLDGALLASWYVLRPIHGAEATISDLSNGFVRPLQGSSRVWHHQQCVDVDDIAARPVPPDDALPQHGRDLHGPRPPTKALCPAVPDASQQALQATAPSQGDVGGGLQVSGVLARGHHGTRLVVSAAGAALLAWAGRLGGMGAGLSSLVELGKA